MSPEQEAFHQDLQFVCQNLWNRSPLLSSVVTRRENKISKSSCPHPRGVVSHSYGLHSHPDRLANPPHLSLIPVREEEERSPSLPHPSPPSLWRSLSCLVAFRRMISDGDLDVATNSCASEKGAEASLWPPGKVSSFTCVHLLPSYLPTSDNGSR